MGPIHMRAHARLILETTLLDLCAPEAMPLPELIARLEASSSAPVGPSPAGARPRERRPEPRPAAPDLRQPPPRRRRAAGASEAEVPAPEPERTITPRRLPPSGRPARRPRPPATVVTGSDARRAPAPQPVQTNSTQDLWDGFLNELAGRPAPLAEITAKRARLARRPAWCPWILRLTSMNRALESPEGRRR